MGDHSSKISSSVLSHSSSSISSQFLSGSNPYLFFLSYSLYSGLFLNFSTSLSVVSFLTRSQSDTVSVFLARSGLGTFFSLQLQQVASAIRKRMRQWILLWNTQSDHSTMKSPLPLCSSKCSPVRFSALRIARGIGERWCSREISAARVSARKMAASLKRPLMMALKVILQIQLIAKQAPTTFHTYTPSYTNSTIKFSIFRVFFPISLSRMVDLWSVKLSQQYNYVMDMNYSFSGMTLTEIFQIQPLQSLFIKFWYLALTSESIVAAQDSNVFKAIRKNVTFANCFTFQMPIRTYVNFVQRILQALAGIDPRRTFQVLLGHLRNNKVVSVSFELFGVAFLQLFGRVLELLNTHTMNKILRRIFIEITILGKMGVSTLKPKGIRPISFEQIIPNFTELLQEKAVSGQMGKPNPEQVSLQRPRASSDREYDVKTIKGRLQAQRDHNYEMRQSVGEHYPVGEKIRNKEKTSISCYMMGGFEIVDYSDSINQLHKKLLTKILLNK